MLFAWSQGMKKLSNHRSPPGLERSILRKMPKYLLASICIPLFMMVFIRLAPVEAFFMSPTQDVDKLHTLIDFFSIAMFVSMLPILLTVIIACIIVVLMKGPAYVADAYKLDDADKPDNEKE